MTERGSWWPLVLGVVVSLSVHVVALPGLTRLAIGRGDKVPATRPSEVPKDSRTPIGVHDGTASSVAWISHEDFREMLARRSVTEQPALQKLVQPVPEAPVALDPTPTNPQTPPMPPAPPAPPTPQATVAIEQAAAPRLAAAADVGTAAAAGPVLPAMEDGPAVSTGRSPAVQPPDRAVRAAESSAAAEGVVQAAAAAAAERARPTSAARADAESDPVRLTGGTLKVRPGKVIVGEGIEIKPARPRFSAVTMASAIPNNPRAKITFDASGRVVDVKMLRSTGYVDFDSPIEASLYKWRASGPRLVELGEGFVVEVELILVE